jgi:hypothetical protein
MRFWLPLFFILGLSAIASAGSDIVGPFGHSPGFSGRFPIVGGIGPGGSGPPPTCLGAIDTSVGCPLPMLGM